MINPKDVAKLITEDPDLFNEGWDELGIQDPTAGESQIVRTLKAGIKKYNELLTAYGSQWEGALGMIDEEFENTPEWNAFHPAIQKTILRYKTHPLYAEPDEPLNYAQAMESYLDAIRR